MKTVLNEKDIKEKIEDLSYKQQSEKLTSQQEKKIVQQIEELKQSLPHAM